MNWRRFSGILLMAMALGCKNDIDINATYKDVAIVFGFLDQNEPVHYIRIEKLYQNSSTLNTSEGAQNTDSLYFDSLLVNLINISTHDTFHCFRVDTIPKDSGFFSSGRNTLYGAIFPKNDAANEVFDLEIYYPAKKIHFSSSCKLVKDAAIPYRKIILKTIPGHYFSFKFTPGRNSFLYDLNVKYTYKEMNAADTNIAVYKTLDYYIAKSAPTIAEKETTYSIGSAAYLDYLKSMIPVDASKVRRTIGISYQAYGASEDFKNMQELSKPNLSIVQKNPIYSNINNGIGIFSSRNNVEVEMGIDPNTIILLGQTLPNFIY